jgi:hypothetical protein
MSIVASIESPGIREQHLLRRRNNPLFAEDRRLISDEELVRARMDDGIEKDNFTVSFQTLVRRAVELQSNAPSETVLEIKEELDRCYQQACALPGDTGQIRQAIRRLVAVIMQAVSRGAGNDVLAQQQLREEEIARTAHFELQEIPLVAALTHTDSPIREDELIPSLLSEPEATLRPALQIFDDAQLAALLHDATAWLGERDPQRQLQDAWQRLETIETAFRDGTPHSQPGRTATGSHETD